ncbi:hypothetical protein GGR56DRAFT_680862 [Xylariaceae sp. FL0804]|nr:hypothetical protein GGR56DRAFT_680862 [Xylariaceae sp. FL0804]
MDGPYPIRVRTPAAVRQAHAHAHAHAHAGPPPHQRAPQPKGGSQQLLRGCWVESERAAQVALQLTGLRDALPSTYRPHLSGVIAEIQTTSGRLRDLADRAQVHYMSSRLVADGAATAVGYSLNVLLPCLCRTLRDIRAFYEDRSVPRERRWRNMYHVLSAELPGTTLPARFVMYNQFLSLLSHLVTRSPNFDIHALESIQARILQLREARKIPPPSPVSRDLVKRDAALDFWDQETDVPRDPKILVKRSFDNDRLSVMVFMKREEDAPYLMIRTKDNNESWVSVQGVHELCIDRPQSCALEFTRWSRTEDRKKVWAFLSFLTWEELVLFHCIFVVLKFYSPAKVNVKPAEVRLLGEVRYFRGQIIKDDGFHHFLSVFQDEHTRGWRLHATVYDGPLRSCPVWTAFVPAEIPHGWISRKSSHKVWLRDLQVFVFCEGYQAQRQRRQRGAFEIRFKRKQACSEFRALFRRRRRSHSRSRSRSRSRRRRSIPDIPPPTVESAPSSDEDEDDDDDNDNDYDDDDDDDDDRDDYDIAGPSNA